MLNQIKTLIDFWEDNQHLSYPFNWLRGRSYSEAFVICIGAGPWKFNRRKAIQGQALKILGKRDLVALSDDEISQMYPLQWQRNFIERAVDNLTNPNSSWRKYDFEVFCSCEPPIGRRTMLSLVGSSSTKVISLFCRDALKVPSFPIDRHVKRKLIELGLPTDEDAVIELCEDAGIDPRKAAVAFVRAASDMDNPDWGIDDSR
jgi:hypothetical protein